MQEPVGGYIYFAERMRGKASKFWMVVRIQALGERNRMVIDRRLTRTAAHKEAGRRNGKSHGNR